MKFPINEPAEGKRKIGIDEYLSFMKGAGVQHIAIEIEDILATVGELRKRGSSFDRAGRRITKTF